MKKNWTELVNILDASGSMDGMQKDTIGGYNSMLEKQKKAEGGAYVSTVLFNSQSKVIHDRADIRNVQPLTMEDYTVGGMTALLDAVGDAIHHIGNVHKYAREEDRPEHTIFVITTDGIENASRRYTLEMVKEMIERQQKKYGWQFVFLGANIDAIKTAGSMGIHAQFAANYHNDARGVEQIFSSTSDMMCCMRANRPVDASWKREIERDFESRGGKL